MPDDGVATTPEKGANNINSRSPAIAATRSFSFLNLSLFQSKRFTSSTPQEQQQHHHHHHSGSIDSATTSCLAFHSFRDALFCEHPMSSPSPCLNQKELPQQQAENRKVSRWRRIVDRFGGKKNRVREEAPQSKPGLVEALDRECSLEPFKPAFKWDVSRIREEQKEEYRSPYELVKPVLEPMRFLTSEFARCPEERKDSSDGGLRKKLRLRADSNSAAEMLVTHLRSKRGKEQGVIAAEMRALARNSPSARATLASLGAVAPLIAMLESPSGFCAHSALLTLYTLASGNDANKAAIVDAGVVPKLLNLVRKRETYTQEAVVANFLCLSALDRNKPLIGSSGAIPELVRILIQSKEPVRWEALRALFNLSLSQPNIKFFVEGDAAIAIAEILKSRDANVRDRDASVRNANVQDANVLDANVRDPNVRDANKDMVRKGHGIVNAEKASEKALAVLGNMVGVAIGRKCVTDLVMEILIDVLGWGVQFAKCQERAAYVLMVVAHHSYGHRLAMVQKRAIPVLLEVSLLGSALAQKRAVRILESLREDRDQGLARPMSAPMRPLVPPRKSKHGDGQANRLVLCEGSQVVNLMVQQSLEQNMQRIVRRANLPFFESIARGDAITRAFSLSGCASSKSLPF